MTKYWCSITLVLFLGACSGPSQEPVDEIDVDLGEADTGPRVDTGRDAAETGGWNISDSGTEVDGAGDLADATDTSGADGDTGRVDASGTTDASETGRPPVSRVIFEGKDPGRAEYRLKAGVRVTGFELEDADQVEGDTASGTILIVGGRDVYYVEGAIEELTVDGNIRVQVDDEIRRNGPERLEGAPSGDKPTIGMTIHSSIALLRRNGRVGEQMVARYAAEAFGAAGFGYEITYNFFPERPPDEKANCSAGQAPQWWGDRVKNGEVDHLAKDINILMLEVGGGGCGAIGGRYGTTPARHIDQMRPWTEVGTDDWHRNMHGTLHEIGHQLGARHDHDGETEGNQHPGNAWNETDAEGNKWWHRTPNVAGAGAPNLCGTAIEQRAEGSVKKRHQTYSECAIENFEVAP